MYQGCVFYGWKQGRDAATCYSPGVREAPSRKEVWQNTTYGQIKLFPANYCHRKLYGIQVKECPTDDQFKFTFHKDEKSIIKTIVIKELCPSWP